jgi:hypothetical protein
MSRLLDDIRSAVLACIPTHPFWVPRRFRVVEMAGERVNLQVVAKALGLPDILPVSISPGMSGLKAKLTPGTIVLVQFVDGDPTQPVITHFAGADQQGFEPVELYLCAGTTGLSPTEHATSAESMVSFMVQFWAAMAVQCPGPVLGIAMPALLPAVLAQAIPATSAVPLLPADAAAIAAALVAKVPNVTGLLPSIGWPNVRGG